MRIGCIPWHGGVCRVFSVISFVVLPTDPEDECFRADDSTKFHMLDHLTTVDISLSTPLQLMLMISLIRSICIDKHVTGLPGCHEVAPGGLQFCSAASAGNKIIVETGNSRGMVGISTEPPRASPIAQPVTAAPPAGSHRQRARDPDAPPCARRF